MANEFKCGKCGQPVSSKVAKCLYCGYLGPHSFIGQLGGDVPTGNRQHPPGRRDSYPAGRPETPVPPPQRRESFGPPAEPADYQEEKPRHAPREVNDDMQVPVSLSPRSPMLDAIDNLDSQEKRQRKEPRRARREKEADGDWKFAGDREDRYERGFIDDEEEEERPKRGGQASLVTTIVSVLLIILFGIAVVAVINNFDELTRWLAKPTVPEFFRPWDQPTSGTSTQQGQQSQPATATVASGASSASQQGDTTPPVISDVNITSVSEYGATIAWKTNEPSNSRVKYKTEIGPELDHLIAGKPSTSHRVVLTQLESGKTYFITIISWDDARNTISQQEKPFQTLSIIDTTPPKLVGQPEVFAGDNTVTISWKTDEKAISQVRYSLGMGYEFSSSLTGTAATDHAIFLSGLSPGTTYHVQLISTDAANNSQTWSDYKFTTEIDTGSRPYMGSQAPGFKLKTLDGGEVTLGQFRGKKVIMNFWASWCSPCKVELPHFQAFWDKYQNNNDVVLLTVAGSDSDVSVLKSVISGSGYKFTVALDDSDDVFNRYEIVSIPKTYFIDKGGVIRRIQQGMFTSLGEIEYMLTSY